MSILREIAAEMIRGENMSFRKKNDKKEERTNRSLPPFEWFAAATR